MIGTTATVRSGAYGRAVRGIDPDARVFGSACPLFVPLVENGFIQPDNEITIKVARIYLEPIIKFETDTLILGCTHYPIIYDILNQLLDYKDNSDSIPARKIARWAHSYLISEETPLLFPAEGRMRVFCHRRAGQLFFHGGYLPWGTCRLPK